MFSHFRILGFLAGDNCEERNVDALKGEVAIGWMGWDAGVILKKVVLENATFSRSLREEVE